MRQALGARASNHPRLSSRHGSQLLLRGVLLIALLSLALAIPSEPAVAGDNVWTGNGPDGGPILALAIDPRTATTLYAGTAGAGVFRSTDGGTTWAPMSNGIIDAAIVALAVARDSSATVYAGSVNTGGYKSTDGGATWTRILSTGVRSLAVDPATPTTVYAGTTGGVYKSIDGGQNWNLANDGITMSNIYALAIDPLHPATVYAGTGSIPQFGTPSGKLFKTIDGGASWTELTTGLENRPALALAVNPTNPSIVYAAANTVFRSTNSGTSWSKMLAEATYELVIDPTLPSTLYAATASGIFKSVNNGDSWGLLKDGLPDTTVWAMAINPVTPSILYAGMAEGGVFRSTNGGTNWNAAYTGLHAADVRALAIDPQTPATLYAGTWLNGAAKSTDGGQSWRPINNGLTDLRVVGLAIDPLTPTTLYAGTWDSGMFKSTNGGQSWNGINNGFISTSDLAAIAIHPNNPSTLYAASSGGLYKSTTSGDSWAPVNGLSSWAEQLVFDPQTPSTMYAGSPFDGVYKSSDGGQSWGLKNTGLTEISVHGLAIDRQNPNTLYVGTYDGLFKTTNGAASWSRINIGSANTLVFAIAVDPRNSSNVYVGRSDGVYKSTDGGATWKAFNVGLKRTDIQALAIDPLNPSNVYAGIYGAGVFAYRNVDEEKLILAKVLDQQERPVPGARVYRNGALVTDDQGDPLVTDAAGNLRLPDNVKVGDTLVALAPQYRGSTVRDQHGGWSYQVNLTNVEIGSDGGLRPFVVTKVPGPQILHVKQSNPLVLFNLVVSIEWNADAGYVAEISQALRSASDFLYDMTDGQMAFGQVAIYDNAEHWPDADIQIATTNVVRPHAYVGGIGDGDRSHTIRVGRAWDGASGNRGSWSAPEGYRTLTHEFGHYALYLYDEYFAFVRDAQGNIIGERPASCTGSSNRNSATEATNASVMDYQYASSELAMRNVAGLWSNLCQLTAQWQVNGESDWETLVRKYADSAQPARWRLSTPADRGGALAGPKGLPASVLDLPQIVAPQSGAEGPVRKLTVYAPDNTGYRGAIVALYKQDGRVIGQGFSDNSGRLDIYGASPGDTLRAASFDGGLAGSIPVGNEVTIALRLARIGGPAIAAAGASIPHLHVVATPAPPPGPGAPQTTSLLVSLQGFGPGADPSVVVTAPGSEVGYAPVLSYSPTTGAYETQVSFSAAERGMGRIRAVGSVGNNLVRLQSTYFLQRLANSQSYSVYSNDGNLELRLEAGALPGSDTYMVIMPPGALPGPLPPGLALVGDAYDVTVSGAATLQKPALLSLRYDKALVNGAAPAGLAIYRWNPNTSAWQPLAGALDTEHRTISAQISALGVYALLAPPGPWAAPLQELFLPLVRR